MFKRLLTRIFPKWFGPKFYRLAPSRYALVELFGHVCLGPCWVRETECYGKTFCEARRLKPGGDFELPMLLGSGAIYRETELTRDEALDRARPDWSPFDRQRIEHDAPICDMCGIRDDECNCPDPEPIKEEEVLPLPFDAIDAILEYHRSVLGSVIDPHIAKLRAWYEQEQSSIPF